MLLELQVNAARDHFVDHDLLIQVELLDLVEIRLKRR